MADQETPSESSRPVEVMRDSPRALAERIALATLAIFAVLVLSSILELPGGYRLYGVLSGSMSPRIPTGSVVVVKAGADYGQGDIITYRSTGDPDQLITHRVVAIDGDALVTRGDANDTWDSQSIPAENIIGRVVFTLPLLGYLVSFTRTQAGVVLLIVVPSVIIIWTELGSIAQEAKRLRAARTTSAEETETSAS